MVEGEFGPGIKSPIIGVKYCCNMSEPLIESFLTHHEVLISQSTISRHLTNNIEQFHDEKEEVMYCGLLSTSYQQLDNTSARVNGEQWATQIICYPFYTSYHTIPHRDRLSILQLLLGPNELKFQFDEGKFKLLNGLKLSIAIINYLKKYCNGLVLSEDELEKYTINLPTKNKSIEIIQRRIKEAAGIIWYLNQDKWPIVEILLTDDATQFDHLALNHALFWIHAGRTIKKFNPLSPANQGMVKKN